MEYQLFHGRPADTRIPKEERCYELLGSLGIEFSRVDHEHADTIEACLGIEGALGCRICKNLLLTNRQQTAVYLLLMPGDKPFSTKVLSKQLGVSRLSFATPEQMLKYLDITPGSVSVLGLMNDSENAVQLVIDRELLADEYLGCHPCINTSSLKLAMSDVLERFLPAVHHEPVFAELPREEAAVK